MIEFSNKRFQLRNQNYSETRDKIYAKTCLGAKKANFFLKN